MLRLMDRESSNNPAVWQSAIQNKWISFGHNAPHVIYASLGFAIDLFRP